MNLTSLTSALQTLAPLDLAADWDNVGWIVECPRDARITRVLVTLDLTDAVVAEAVATKASVVVAYHPPVFSGLKRLTDVDPVGRRVLACVRAGIGVYAPHSALDAVEGGVNDWLADGLGKGSRSVIDATQSLASTEHVKVVVFVPESHLDEMRDALADAGAGRIGAYTHCSFAIPGTGSFFGTDATNPVVGKKGRLEFAPEVRLEMVASESALPAIAAALRLNHPYEEPAWEVVRLVAKASARTGQGRFVTLDGPTPLATLVKRVKARLGVKSVHVAMAPRHARGSVRSIALCAGAGGSVLESVTADVLWTGELRHHDVLAALSRGSSVIVAGHAETERPYLPVFAKTLANALGRGVRVRVAASDRGPFTLT